MAVFKVRPITNDYIGADTIFFDPAVSEIFYFKHDVEVSIVIIFIGNPDVDSLCAITNAPQFYPKATPLLATELSRFAAH